MSLSQTGSASVPGQTQVPPDWEIMEALTEMMYAFAGIKTLVSSKNKEPLVFMTYHGKEGS
jgi:hypothetical protein